MAHHVAALIESAEKETGARKDAAERACANAILELWKHRAELPRGARPFAGLERIIATLAALDPEAHQPFYRFDVPEEFYAETGGKDDPALQLMRGALSIDHAARLLIDYCMSQVAVTAAASELDWVRAAASAELASGDDSKLTIVLADKAHSSWERDHERRTLKDRIERLKQFAKFAAALEAELASKLAALDVPPPNEGVEEP